MKTQHQNIHNEVADLMQKYRQHISKKQENDFLKLVNLKRTKYIALALKKIEHPTDKDIENTYLSYLSEVKQDLLDRLNRIKRKQQ